MSEKNMPTRKILVADDSLTIQKVIRLALSGDGYEIQTVSDGREAMEQASLFRPDICIIDVSLPQLDAYQVREQMMAKPDLKNIPVILMSSAFEKVDETRAQSLGFAGHLIKPFDPSHLRSILHSVTIQTPVNDPVISTINSPINSPANDPVQMHSRQRDQTIRFDPPSLQDLPPLAQHYDAPVKEMEVSSIDDIQQLAKNTFELSGLDQHDWGMIEPGRSEVIADIPQQPYPTPQPHEVGTLDFNDVPHVAGYNENTDRHISVTPEQLESMVKDEVSKILNQMQSQMRDQMEHEMRAYTQDQIPNIAERIIREEIHRLLSEPPV